jgi:hypothetical protein
VEEYPAQSQLITITTELNNNGDSFEENNKVEDDIKYIYIYIFGYLEEFLWKETKIKSHVLVLST